MEAVSATGVYVLTCGPPDSVEGVTVSTLTVSSHRPPMVSVALREGSRGLGTLLASSTFVVNALSSEQSRLARHFASRKRERGTAQLGAGAWAGVSSHGVPRLDGALAWLECRVQRTVRVGDHRVVFCDVLCSSRHLGTPLVGFAGSLHPGLPQPAVTSPERNR